jgi:hypothetical protein
MKSKQIKLIIILTALILLQIYSVYYEVSACGWTLKTKILSVFSFVISAMLIGSLILRRKLSFKAWILSKMNFLMAKEVTIFTSEIPKNLLFEKLLEVIEESDFDFADSNKDTFEIVATTFPNFFTWGENMYIEISDIENEMSEIKFTSATIFGYSWKRNKKNTDKFFQLFEESLTI